MKYVLCTGDLGFFCSGCYPRLGGECKSLSQVPRQSLERVEHIWNRIKANIFQCTWLHTLAVVWFLSAGLWQFNTFLHEFSPTWMKKNSKLIEKTDFDINVSMTLLLKNIRTIRFPVLWILRHIKLGKIILKILHLSPSNDTQGQCPLQNRLKTRVYPGNCCV